MPSVKQRCDEWWLWWRCSPTVGVWSQTQQRRNGKDQRVHQQTHRSSSSQPRREPEAESEAPLVPVLQRKAASVSVRLHSQAQTLLMSVIHAVIDGQCDSFHRPILTESSFQCEEYVKKEEILLCLDQTTLQFCCKHKCVYRQTRSLSKFTPLDGVHQHKH